MFTNCLQTEIHSFHTTGLVSSFPLCTAPIIPPAASHHVTL